MTLTLFFFFISGCDFFGSNKQIKEQVADLIILPFQKISLSKTDNFDAYEAAINGEYTCFVSQLAPEGSPFKYQYHQIKLLFAPRLLTEISDLKVVQGLRYSLDEERSGDTKRYARCLFPKSEKLSRLLLQHLQFDPTQPLPENLMIDETSLSSPLSKTANTFKMICSTTTITSTIQGVTYPSLTRINYDDCIEIHIEFLTPPDLPAMPIWDYEQYAGGGGGVGGGDTASGGDHPDDVLEIPPDCNNFKNLSDPKSKTYCKSPLLNEKQKQTIKNELDKIYSLGGICAILAELGYRHLNNFKTFSGATYADYDVRYDHEKHPIFGFALPYGDYIALLDDLVNEPTVYFFTSSRRPPKMTLRYALVHELDHLYGYQHPINESPKTKLESPNAASCSQDPQKLTL